jgi:type I restriction enzyme S subunit
VKSVPSGWRETRLRYAALLNPSKAEARALPAGTEVSFLPMEAVREDGTFDLSQTRAVEEVAGGYTFFRNGDVLLAKITPCFENGKAALVDGLQSGFGFGSTEFHVLRARAGLDPQFLFYVTRSQPFMEQGTASMFGAGGQKRVPTDFLQDYRLMMPPVTEQRIIAEFLDRETARIDALVAKQEDFLTLLYEQRRVMVADAITNGVSAAALKSTGVETYPRLPSHWAILRLKHLIQPGTSISYGIVQPGPHLPDGMPFVQTADLTKRRFSPDDLQRTDPEIAASYPRSRIRRGDVMLGIRASVGDAALVPDQLDGANLSRGIARIVPAARLTGAYLVHALSTPQSAWFWSLNMQGSTFREVSIETVRELPVPVPPIAEQTDIVAHLDARLARHDALRARATQMIERLREHRAALITAAVTGGVAAARPLADRGPAPARAA